MYVAVAQAYWDMAQHVVDQRSGLIHFSRAFQVIPLVYLYRHYVELTLNAIIKEGDEIFGTDYLVEIIVAKLWRKVCGVTPLARAARRRVWVLSGT